MHVTCIHSSHPIFLFPVICFELPLTRTFFDFPRRFELSGVDCTSFVFSMSIAFSITPRFNQGEPDDGQKHGPHLVQRGNETWSSFSMPVSVTERAILSFLSRCLTSLLGKVTVEPLLRTPLYYGQFPMSRQNSRIFSLKKKPLYNTDSL